MSNTRIREAVRANLREVDVSVKPAAAYYPVMYNDRRKDGSRRIKFSIHTGNTRKASYVQERLQRLERTPGLLASSLMAVGWNTQSIQVRRQKHWWGGQEISLIVKVRQNNG